MVPRHLFEILIDDSVGEALNQYLTTGNDNGNAYTRMKIENSYFSKVDGVVFLILPSKTLVFQSWIKLLMLLTAEKNWISTLQEVLRIYTTFISLHILPTRCSLNAY